MIWIFNEKDGNTEKSSEREIFVDYDAVVF